MVNFVGFSKLEGSLLSFADEAIPVKVIHFVSADPLNIHKQPIKKVDMIDHLSEDLLRTIGSFLTPTLDLKSVSKKFKKCIFEGVFLHLFKQCQASKSLRGWMTIDVKDPHGSKSLQVYEQRIRILYEQLMGEARLRSGFSQLKVRLYDTTPLTVPYLECIANFLNTPHLSQALRAKCPFPDPYLAFYRNGDGWMAKGCDVSPRQGT